jgi:transposase
MGSQVEPGSDEQSVTGVTSGLGPKRKRGETPRQQIRQAKKATRRRFSAEEKIQIVMEGIRGEEPVSALCRREGIQSTVYYRWLKEFMEAGKQRLVGDTLREAGRSEVKALQEENARLKQLVAEYALEVLRLKRGVLGER